MTAGLDSLDRRAGGDAAHDRHRDWAAAIVVVLGVDGSGPHAAEVALDHARPEAARAAAADAVGDRVGQLDHFDGTRPVGQAADEAAFLQCCDQPVDAGFGTQVEGVLHFIERGGYPGLGQPFVDEAQELELLAGQHLSLPGSFSW
jgi:hypothetical protein